MMDSLQLLQMSNYFWVSIPIAVPVLPAYSENKINEKNPNAESAGHLILSLGTAKVKKSGYWHSSKDVSKFTKKLEVLRI